MKLASCSFSAPYECQQNWPIECSVQAGGNGIVFDPKHSEGGYNTAFFEAFPDCNGIKTFIRGEGATIAEAETQAWEKYQRALSCTHSTWSRRHLANGGAFCDSCGVFDSKHFEPSTHCVVCQKPTNWVSDKNNIYYCQEHDNQMPEEAKSELQKFMDSFNTRHENR